MSSAPIIAAIPPAAQRSARGWVLVSTKEEGWLGTVTVLEGSEEAATHAASPAATVAGGVNGSVKNPGQVEFGGHMRQLVRFPKVPEGHPKQPDPDSSRTSGASQTIGSQSLCVSGMRTRDCVAKPQTNPTH